MRKVLVLFIFSCLFLYSNNENQNSDEGSSGSATSAGNREFFAQLEREKNDGNDTEWDIDLSYMNHITGHEVESESKVIEGVSRYGERRKKQKNKQIEKIEKKGKISFFESKTTVQKGKLSHKLRSNIKANVDFSKKKIKGDAMFIPYKEGANVEIIEADSKGNCKKTKAEGIVYVSRKQKRCNKIKPITLYPVSTKKDSEKNKKTSF